MPQTQGRYEEICRSYLAFCYTNYLVGSKYINITKFCVLTTDLNILTLRVTLSQTDKLTHVTYLLLYRKPTATWKSKFFHQHLKLITGTLPILFTHSQYPTPKIEKSQEREMSCFLNEILTIKILHFSSAVCDVFKIALSGHRNGRNANTMT